MTSKALMAIDFANVSPSISAQVQKESVKIRQAALRDPELRRSADGDSRVDRLDEVGVDLILQCPESGSPIAIPNAQTEQFLRQLLLPFAIVMANQVITPSVTRERDEDYPDDLGVLGGSIFDIDAEFEPESADWLGARRAALQHWTELRCLLKQWDRTC